MRISELSRRAGVPTSTIKFYIREGLVPAGARSQRNQASYDETHLQRLDLIRALREVANLSLEVVRSVIEQVDKPWGEGDPIGAAIEAIYRVPERDRNAAELEEYAALRGEVEAFMTSLDWWVPHEPNAAQKLNVDRVADALLQLRRYIDPEFSLETLRGFAAGAWLISEAAFERNEDRVPFPGDDLVDPTRTAILGMLLLDPLVMGFVRSALTMRSLRISKGLALPPAR